MGQARDLPLHIQREVGVIGHPPESEEKWCEPCTALRSAQVELAGGDEWDADRRGQTLILFPDSNHAL